MTSAPMAPGPPIDAVPVEDTAAGTVHPTAPTASLTTRLRTLAAPAIPVLRRITAPVTPLGAMVIGAVVVCAAVGWWLGWQEFGVAAVVLAAALVVSALFLIGRSSYAVDVDLYTQRVVAGTHANGALTVRNTGSRRLLPSRIELTVGPSLASFRIPGLAGGAQAEDLFVIPTSQRSVIAVGPAVSVRGDALGLLRRQVRWTDVTQLYVHPRTVRLAGASTGVLRDLEGQPTRDLSSNDVSFHALRPYVPGDDRRYVHWRTSARTGALMVRQFEETRRTHLAVALSANPSDYADPEEFELAVSVAASLSVQAVREERPVTVCVGARVMSPGSVQRLLDGFAGVRTSDDAGLLRSSLAAAAAVPNASVAMVITGSVPDAAVIRRAGSTFPTGIRVLAVRADCSATVGLATLGGVDVATVADLSDLPAVMHRMRAA